MPTQVRDVLGSKTVGPSNSTGYNTPSRAKRGFRFLQPLPISIRYTAELLLVGKIVVLATSNDKL